MKFYQIALYLFIFNLSLSIVNSLGVFDVWIQPDTNWQKDVNLTGHQINQSSYNINPTMIFGDFIMGLRVFVQSVGNATILLPFFLNQMGVPPSMRDAITAIVWFSYVVGIIQFVSGRSLRAYE